MTTIAEILEHVEEAIRAETKEQASLAKSLIAAKLAPLTGESMQAAFDALRTNIDTPLRLGNVVRHHVSVPEREHRAPLRLVETNDVD